jgi:hypothetical protein
MPGLVFMVAIQQIVATLPPAIPMSVVLPLN